MNIPPSESIASQVDFRLQSIFSTAMDQERSVVLPIGIDDQAKSKKVRRDLSLGQVFSLDRPSRSRPMRRSSMKSGSDPVNSFDRTVELF